MHTISLIIGIIFGICIGAFIAMLSLRKAHTARLHQAGNALNQSEQAKVIAQTERAITQDRLDSIKTEYEQLRRTYDNQTQQLQHLTAQLSTQTTENKHLQEQITGQRQEIEAIQKRLTTEFENIANRILRNQSAEFAGRNEKQIGELLTPLRDKIATFEKKVEATYEKELRDKLSLSEEVKKLTEMNLRMSQDADNLAKALKGDVKKQGNWGEIILERVLERSGLTRGQEYEREEVLKGSEGETIRPDVIIHLPDNKHIIIDSKVSLVAYERYINAPDETAKEAHLKSHILSIRNHVKGLGEKNYQLAGSLNTPDFVLLFMPIEAAFAAAVQADPELFAYAWEQHIVIVSPTTLLATLRTIASIWKQENQTKNAREIARLSGTLYDKLVGFTEDMEKIRVNIDRASKSYDDAVRKLKDGNGNMIRTAEKIKELGAKTGSKTLPPAFTPTEE